MDSCSKILELLASAKVEGFVRTAKLQKDMGVSASTTKRRLFGEFDGLAFFEDRDPNGEITVLIANVLRVLHAIFKDEASPHSLGNSEFAFERNVRAWIVATATIRSDFIACISIQEAVIINIITSLNTAAKVDSPAITTIGGKEYVGIATHTSQRGLLGKLNLTISGKCQCGFDAFVMHVGHFLVVRENQGGVDIVRSKDSSKRNRVSSCVVTRKVHFSLHIEGQLAVRNNLYSKGRSSVEEEEEGGKVEAHDVLVGLEKGSRGNNRG